MQRPPPRYTLFPYTTLFRSTANEGERSAPFEILSVANEREPSMDGSRSFATDRKSTRLNSSHVAISYAVFCLKKKKCDRVEAVRDLSRSRLRHLPPLSSLAA